MDLLLLVSLIEPNKDDGVLRMFIDDVFDEFDYDKDGTLSVNELHTFFNKLYIALNDPRRFTA